MNFKIFDDIPESVIFTKLDGEIIYCNSAFANLVKLSKTRILSKKAKLAEIISGIWQDEFNSPDESSSSSCMIVNYKLQSGEKGIGQVTSQSIKVKEELCRFIYLRDYEVEEKIKNKYRQEEMARLKKIEEIQMLVDILKRSRLIKEPFIVTREYFMHILKHYNIPFCIYREADGSKILWSQNIRDPNNDEIISAWNFFNDLENFHQFHEDANWIYTPITHKKNPYLEILFPKISSTNDAIDVELIQTLSQHTNMIIENINLEKIATYDDLTKLKNSRVFRDLFSTYMNDFPRLHLLILDIDHFKKVNDTHGHPAGDQVLREVAGCLRQFEEGETVCARVGGEEFAMLIPRVESAQAIKIAEEIRKSIEALKIVYADKVIPVTSSFGLTARVANDNEKSLYRRADELLYKSKQGGRNRVTTDIT